MITPHDKAALKARLKAEAAFFAPDPGVGDAPPVPSVKVGGEDPPVIFTNTANLDGFEPLVPLYPPSHCTMKYVVIGCKCNRRILPSSCMSLDCEICAPHVGKRRADSVLRRLLGDVLYQRPKHWKRAVIFTSFTIPPKLRESFLDNKAWSTVRKKAWRILKKNFGAKYGVEASHPIGDKNPNVFHPHLNFLWVQRPGWRPFIDKDVLQREWCKVLDVEMVDVYTQYSHHVRQIAHWAKYICRTFPGNHKWAGCLRWYGKYPKQTRPDKVTCADCGSTFRVIGYVSVELVDQWFEHGQLMGRAPPWERDADIDFFSHKKVGA